MATPVAEDIDSAMHILHNTALKKDYQDDIQKFYDSWAENYDEHVDKASYNGPALSAEALDKVLSDKSAHIVDCAAGTGKVGQELANRGFKRIDGVDFSQKCLDIGASRGVYERLICDRLGKNKIKGVDDGYYSALTCVGALSIGHLTPDVFTEWNRIVKKGGLMVFTLSWAMMDGDPQEHVDTMTEMKRVIDGFIQDGTWELIGKVDISLIRKVGRADMYTIRRV